MASDRAVTQVIGNMQAVGALCCPIEQCLKQARNLLLGNPSICPSTEIYNELFPSDYEPGTFTIAERKTMPDFLYVEDKTSFSEWAKSESCADCEKILPVLLEKCPSIIRKRVTLETVGEKVLECLESDYGMDRPLSNWVFQQEYTDVLRRIVLTYLTGWCRVPFTEYDHINEQLFPVALSIANRCSQLDPSVLLRLSAAAGLVGLNLKRNASAASTIFHERTLPVDFSKPVTNLSEDLYRSLSARVEHGWALDNEQKFLSDLGGADDCVTLVVFSDDFFETVIDMKLLERLLAIKPNLKVFMIPRALRFGNDAGYGDVLFILSLAPFQDLAKFYQERRFVVESHGPLSGNVNGLRLSESVLEVIRKADVLYIKGARSYECLQGLKKNCYFSFAVCRGISESVTGICAETGGLVLIHQLPGEKSFNGFRNRHKRPRDLPSGRRCWLSERTAVESMER